MEVEVVECGHVGYGAAANRGVEAAGEAEWVLISNADVTFSADFGGRLRVCMEGGGGEAGCFAPRLLNPDGTLQPSVGKFPTLWGVICDQFRRRERRKYAYPQPVERRVVDWATGACLLVRREAFEAVGGFDEKYFLYVEEVDLQRRMRDAGHRTVFVPEAVATHHAAECGAAAAGGGAAMGVARVAAVFAKFGGWWTLRGYGVLAVVSGRFPRGRRLRVGGGYWGGRRGSEGIFDF